jgi:DNA-binding NarL/FixJ family response regulator
VTPEPLRSAVVFDRSQLWLHSLEHFVLPAIGVVVRARTTSAEEAVELVEKHEPQLLVAGIDSGTDSGELGCVERARGRVAGLQVVVWSSVGDPRAIKAAFAAGAAAYVLKSARADDFKLAIMQTFERSIYLAKEWPLGEMATGPEARKASEILTPRELEVLELVVDGYSNAQLARILWVTEETVKFHLSNVYQKLEVTNRTEASRWAHLHGVVPAEGLSTRA